MRGIGMVLIFVGMVGGGLAAVVVGALSAAAVERGESSYGSVPFVVVAVAAMFLTLCGVILVAGRREDRSA